MPSSPPARPPLIGAATLVLASGSPRRREMLERLGLRFEVMSPDVDETPIEGEPPAAYVERIACLKADAAAATADTRVLAADTALDVDGDILGKPADHDGVAEMLRRLSGRSHLVHSGVALRHDGATATIVVTTEVTMSVIDDDAIRWYADTGEPLDKAGAYAIQGAGAVFVQRIRGSHSNVVGLPLAEVADLFVRAGTPLAVFRTC